MVPNYQIEVVFDNGGVFNLTEPATLPNGIQYAVRTTLQYFSYRPSSNTAWLTVEPTATQAMAASNVTAIGTV